MKQPRHNKQHWVRCLIALWILLVPGFSGAENLPDEYDIKIVYLYNFTKFVSWPESAFSREDAPLNICIMGHLPSRETLQLLDGKKTRQHTIAVQLLAPHQRAQDCHILFLTKSLDYAATRKVIQSLSSPTLVVGETADFARHGGTIGFILDDQRRVRIEVNLEQATRQDIAIRAQLLEIARKVYRNQENT